MSKKRDYRTKQGNAILEILDGSRDRHMTVYDIAAELEKRGSSVGMTTVYRHIDRLLAEGRVQKYILDGGSAAYQYIDGACQERFHLKCEHCGELIHLECDEMRALYRHVMEEHGFQINSPKTVFYGTCGACRAAEDPGAPDTTAPAHAGSCACGACGGGEDKD